MDDPSKHPRGALIVTGAGRGIGAATARLAAARGYAVCVNYRENRAAADAVVAAISKAGGTAVAVAANAGILEHHMRVDEMSAGRLARVFATNVVGAFLCAREAVRRMSTKHGGTGGAIVNVSSVAATLGSPNEYVDYAASKGAIDTLTVGLAKEVALEGVRVNGVRPGVIHTEIHASGGEPDRVERVKAAVPMRRGGTPEEVARAILWLLSEESSYCTGTSIDVSGGR